VTEGEDRFGDLGPERRSAAERLEERDRTHPEPDDGPPEAPRPTSRYAWVVGIAFLIVIAVAGLNAVQNEGKGSRGPTPGAQLPRFSAPLATGPLEGDANVCQRRRCSAGAGKLPACDVRSPGVVNSCELWKRRPLVLTLVFDRAADCFPQVDRVQRAMKSAAGVQYAVVYFSRNERDEVRATVKRRGWTMPVAHDEDGAVTNLYGVGVCPTTVFALRGGKVVRTELGNLTESKLRTRVRGLLRRQRSVDRRARS
jgi:AhpC/TSA family